VSSSEASALWLLRWRSEEETKMLLEAKNAVPGARTMTAATANISCGALID
jgi:hypothetical protein